MNKYIVKTSLSLIVLYGLWWLFVGAYYAYPNTEDLSVIAFSRDNGIVWSTVNVLHSNDGRYLVNFLHGLNPLALNWYYGYQWMPIFAISCLMLSVNLLMDELFPKKQRIENVLFASGITVVFLSTIDLSLSLYWMICSFVYIYPLFLFLFSFTFFIKYSRTFKRKHYILSLIFLLLANGNSELYFPIFGLFIFSIALKFWKKEKVRPAIVGYLIIYGLTALLFLSSPGVMARFHSYDDQRSLALQQVLPSAFKYSVESIFNFSNFLVLIFLIAFGKVYSISNKLKRSQLIALISTAILLIVFSWVFTIFATGDVSKATRILPVISILSFISLFFVALLVESYVKLSSNLLILGFSAGFLFANNSLSAIQEDFNSGKLSRYKKEMDHQYNVLSLKNTSNDSCAIVVTLNNIAPFLPKSVALVETRNYLQPNREDGKTNRAYEDYFRVDEVRMKNDTTQLILKRVYEKFN